MSDHFISPSRRRILQVLFGGSLAAVAAAVLYAITKFILPLPGQIVSMLAGNARDPSAGDPTHVIKLGMNDVMLLREQDGSFVALDLKCTHAGCIVNWPPDQNNFKCPCHGGEYDTNGKVVKGPPPRPLNR